MHLMLKELEKYTGDLDQITLSQIEGFLELLPEHLWHPALDRMF